MTCPRCRQPLLFPDVTDRGVRERLCGICGWTQYLNADGTPYQAPNYYAKDDEPRPGQLPQFKDNNPWALKPLTGCSINPAAKGGCLKCPAATCVAGDKAEEEKYRRSLWFGGRPVAELTVADVPLEVQRAGITERAAYRRLATLKREAEMG